MASSYHQSSIQQEDEVPRLSFADEVAVLFLLSEASIKVSEVELLSRSISSGEARRPPQADSRRVLVASVRVISPR